MKAGRTKVSPFEPAAHENRIKTQNKQKEPPESYIGFRFRGFFEPIVGKSRERCEQNVKAILTHLEIRDFKTDDIRRVDT